MRHSSILLLAAAIILRLSAADFIPMTPMGAECIPVSLSVSGQLDLREKALDQLTEDIDFSGLLVTSDDGYAEAEVNVERTLDGIRLSARVSSGGEELLSRTYSGENVYSLCHAFADDLVYDLTGEQGIASTWIAYISRTSEGYALAVKSQDPRSARRVMSDSDVITTPAWSPDGDLIVFTSYRSGNADLWSYNFSSSSASKILSLRGLNSSPAWSPDGSTIALTLSRSGNSDIYLLDPGSSTTTRLTLRESIETSPSFSPTGTQIVYTSDRLGYPQLYVMDSSGGTSMRITSSHGYCDSPAWSPDGDRIAYTARVGGDFHIFVMDADGSNVRQLTFDGTLNEDPVWGPTGRHIAFSSDMDGSRAIYVIELNGLTVRKISGAGECYCPTWSPLEFR
jgi:TolB protein